MPNVAATDLRRLIDAQPLSGGQTLMFVLLFLTLAIDGLDTQVTSYLAPAIGRQWQVSMTNLGLLFSAGLAGSAIGALTLGTLGDVLGSKRVVMAATLIIGIATLVMGLARSMEQLAVLRFITGVGVGGSLPNLIALASQWAPTRLRATLVTMTGCGFPAGATLAGVVSGGLLAAEGWRTVYQVAGVFPLLLLPLIVWVLPESIPKLLQRPDGQQAVRKVFERLYPLHALDGPLTWPRPQSGSARAPIVAIFENGTAARSVTLSAIFILSLMNLYFVSNWLPGLLQQTHRSASESIIATTMLNVGGICGPLLLGRLIDRFGFGILGFSLLGAAGCMVALGWFDFTGATLFIAAFVAGFFVLGGQGAVNSLPALVYPDHLRATGAGWAVGTGRFGSIIGPALAGMLLAANWHSSQVLMVAAVAPATAACLLAMLAFKSRTSAARAGAQKWA